MAAGCAVEAGHLGALGRRGPSQHLGVGATAGLLGGDWRPRGGAPPNVAEALADPVILTEPWLSHL